ncbi:hypothetical protein H2198_004106 [Neophaeococcomyces mojaviensis]|uniref:Uncharacterized protein n=1 Tax=Neophaeococcomyces mojaviensis TaxID=3383035 RepID=A0ACC3A9L1_9EURO|nr:hypothetical protein H2198_004106 [Knufia sp. JES_112]
MDTDQLTASPMGSNLPHQKPIAPSRSRQFVKYSRGVTNVWKEVAKCVEKGLSPHLDYKHGVLYAAKAYGEDIGDKRYVKIGSLLNSDGEGIKDIQTKCKQQTEQDFMTPSFIGAHRAEIILHKYFHNDRHARLDCGCEEENCEWYDKDPAIMRHWVLTIYLWFMKRPYDFKSGQLVPQWSSALSVWLDSFKSEIPISMEEFFLLGPNLVKEKPPSQSPLVNSTSSRSKPGDSLPHHEPYHPHSTPIPSRQRHPSIDASPTASSPTLGLSSSQDISGPEWRIKPNEFHSSLNDGKLATSGEHKSLTESTLIKDKKDSRENHMGGNVMENYSASEDVEDEEDDEAKWYDAKVHHEESVIGDETDEYRYSEDVNVEEKLGNRQMYAQQTSEEEVSEEGCVEEEHKNSKEDEEVNVKQQNDEKEVDEKEMDEKEVDEKKANLTGKSGKEKPNQALSGAGVLKDEEIQSLVEVKDGVSKSDRGLHQTNAGDQLRRTTVDVQTHIEDICLTATRKGIYASQPVGSSCQRGSSDASSARDALDEKASKVITHVSSAMCDPMVSHLAASETQRSVSITESPLQARNSSLQTDPITKFLLALSISDSEAQCVAGGSVSTRQTTSQQIKEQGHARDASDCHERNMNIKGEQAPPIANEDDTNGKVMDKRPSEKSTYSVSSAKSPTVEEDVDDIIPNISIKTGNGTEILGLQSKKDGQSSSHSEQADKDGGLFGNTQWRFDSCSKTTTTPASKSTDEKKTLHQPGVAWTKAATSEPSIETGARSIHQMPVSPSAKKGHLNSLFSVPPNCPGEQPGKSILRSPKFLPTTSKSTPSVITPPEPDIKGVAEVEAFKFDLSTIQKFFPPESLAWRSADVSPTPQKVATKPALTKTFDTIPQVPEGHGANLQTDISDCEMIDVETQNPSAENLATFLQVKDLPDSGHSRRLSESDIASKTNTVEVESRPRTGSFSQQPLKTKKKVPWRGYNVVVCLPP